MNGQLTAAVAAAFAQVLAIAGVPIVGPNGIERQCVSGPVSQNESLRDSGFWTELSATIELFNDDFQTLGISDRSIVQVGGKQLQVMLIEPHPLAPTTKLHLKRCPLTNP